MGFRSIGESIEENGKVIFITSLIMTIFFIVVSVLVFFISLKPADQVLVPNIQGEKLEDALLKLQVKELYPRLQLKFSDNSADMGRVLEQNPPAGTIVKAGRRINLVVSSGTVIDRVENYVGKTLTEVQQYFASLFSSGRKHLMSIKEPIMYKASSIPAGTILEQNPAPDTEIVEGGFIEFIVSKGPENDQTEVPQLLGASLNDIYDAMEKNKLCFSFRGELDSSCNAIIVSSQDLEKGTMVDSYSEFLIDLKLPPSTVKLISGIYSFDLPKYPYPVRVSLDAVYPNGKREEVVSFNHFGGRCDLPYALPPASVIVITVLNKQVQMFEVKQEE